MRLANVEQPSRWRRGFGAACLSLALFGLLAADEPVTVHRPAGDWSIFRPMGAAFPGERCPKNGPVPLPAEGDSPIFAANIALSLRDALSAAKIGTVPGERLDAPDPNAEPPAQAAEEAAPFTPPDGEPVRAVLIRFEGQIFPRERAYLFRKLDTAQRDGANLLLIEIESPGGAVDDSQLIAERLRDITWAHTVAFVPREALSGAAMMALGCDDIVMAPGARLGNVGVVVLGENKLFRHAPEKDRSDVVAVMRELAEAKGRPPALAEAMVDKDTVVYQWTHAATEEKAYMSAADVKALPDADQWQQGPMVRASREGLFLDVNGREALDLGLAQALAEDREALKRRYGIEGPLRVLQPTGVDTAVYILNLAPVTGLLFVLGLIALYVELSSPGIGIGALVAALCFALFFWSRFLGGTAEWLELVLFAAGVVFLLVEMLILPGFGVFGITGILLIFVSLMMAMQGFVIPETRRQMAIFANSIGVLAMSGVAFAVAASLLRRYFGAIPLFNQLLLHPPASGRPGRRGLPAEGEPEPAVGDRGVAHTALRPAGKARFGGRYLNVVTDSEFVRAGARIEIVELRGGRVFVRPC